MDIFHYLLFPLSLLSSIVGSLIRVPALYEKVTKDADVYVLVGKVTLGSQDVYGMIDTSSSTTFFLWKHWYEKGHPGKCKDIIFGCYECSPEVCSEGKLYTLRFGHGAEVRIFEESATAYFGQAASATITFGLVAEYTYGPNVPVPHAGFGLLPKQDPKSPYVPIIEQLLSQKLIESDIFSIYLKHDGTNLRGELLLGGSDPSIYKSPLVYAVNKPKCLRVTGFSMGGGTYPVMAVNDPGIIDSGAECILIHKRRYTLPKLIQDLEARSSSKVTITQSGTKLIVDCNQRQHLPPIEFLLKGEDNSDVKVKIPSDAYVNVRTDAQGQAYCRVLLDVAEYPIWVIGLPSFIGHYILYDWKNGRIGISELK